MGKAGKGKVRKIVLIIIGILLLLALAAGGIFYHRMKNNIRYRMLQSMLNMGKETLQNPEYILNDIDIMKLCREYMNGDISVHGTVGLTQVENFNFSLNITVDGERSASQRRMRSDSKLKVLRYEVGDVDFFAEDSKIYFEAPILGDMAFSFDTGKDLFPQAPDMTSDIDAEWFKENNRNIRDFVKEIEIEELDSSIEDEDGTSSQGYRVTMSAGSGRFLWDLMGMEAPGQDRNFVIYLTKENRIRRVEMDVSDMFENGIFTVDGVNMGNVEFSCDLPDNEHVRIHAVRNVEYHHRIDAVISYDTRNQENFRLEYAFEWMNYEDDSGIECKAKGIKLYKNEEKLATGSFKGDIQLEQNLEDVFDGRGEELHGLEPRSWQQIRDRVNEFVLDVLDKLRIF